MQWRLQLDGEARPRVAARRRARDLALDRDPLAGLRRQRDPVARVEGFAERARPLDDQALPPSLQRQLRVDRAVGLRGQAAPAARAQVDRIARNHCAIVILLDDKSLGRAGAPCMDGAVVDRQGPARALPEVHLVAPPQHALLLPAGRRNIAHGRAGILVAILVFALVLVLFLAVVLARILLVPHGRGRRTARGTGRDWLCCAHGQCRGCCGAFR
mmetsp:Transcript_100398/g.288491  ORF Transcript_100398/g.288491 Transcript_100398/m.288491 type:complete len:215 (+) Transcript_100398:40-684(+)